MERFILHVDVNNAFLSWTAVEMLKNGATLDIRTIPSVIGGDEEQRHGIVLAKSPVAKQFGIKTGEPLYFARKKCPNLQVYAGDFRTYRKYSNAMIEIFKRHTSQIEQFSIDECFLDLTGFLLPNENLLDRAYRISKEIKQELGFTVNIGVSSNKLLAKMASDFEKPDKVHTLYPDEIPNKMWPLSIADLFMVGRKSLPKLEKMGIKTIGDLAKKDEKDIIKKFGKYGKIIWEYANGIDNSKVEENNEKPKGIGNSITLPQDISDIENLEKVLLSLTEQVTFRLRKHGILANTVNVQLKTNEFQNISHQKKLNSATSSTKIIYVEAKKLLHELYNKSSNKQIRLVGMRVDNLTEVDEMQLSIFSELEERGEKLKQEKLDTTIDNIKNKYGYNKITRGANLEISKNIKFKD